MTEESEPSDETLVEHDDSVQEIVYALSDFKGLGNHQLSFTKGSTIKVLHKSSDHWWWADIKGCHGYIPVNHLTYSSVQQSAWQDEEYFGNYGNLKLHHEMLSDGARTLAYQTAIQKNADSLVGKVVVDVGCGTGILSMMCARYGDPQKVYAVEASDMASHTMEVIKQNQMSEVIDVIHGYAEDLKLEPGSVDVIISEWMGTILLFEMMIESVIQVRDRFLKKDGMMWPSAASLFLAPCSAHAQYHEKVEFWDSQFGFDFTPLKSLATEETLNKPIHNHQLKPDDCLSTASELFSLDMRTVCVQDLEEINSEFEFEISADGIFHGFCMWFEVDFHSFIKDGERVTLNTGPWHELTHWKQNLFLLDTPIHVKTGEIIKGYVKISRNKEWRRHLLLFLKFRKLGMKNADEVMDEEQSRDADYEKLFHIWR